MTTDQRLSAIRGGAAPKLHNARTIAALTSNPGCTLRAILDAAGADKQLLARRVNHSTSYGQLSRLAVARGNSFEQRVKAEGGTELLRLLRDLLDLPTAQAHYEDLDTTEDGERTSTRYRRSQQTLTRTASADTGSGTLFDHPMLRIRVGGVWAYLEPDVIAFKLNDRFYIVEIKSFPIIDGKADPGKVGAAARQSAVYVLALQELLDAAGFSRDLVSHEVVLVCPKDFSNQPMAALLDVRKQMMTLRRQLARMDAIGTLLKAVPEDVTFDLRLNEHGEPTRPAADLAQALSSIPARYAPECMSSCEMSKFCRNQVRSRTVVLGRTVREDLGGVEDIGTALALATGRLAPTGDLVQSTQLLRDAFAMREAYLRGTL